jgi:predicted ATPase
VGSGKTQVGDRGGQTAGAEAYPGGVWFVSLASGPGRRQAIALIGRALGLEPSPDAQTLNRIEDALRGGKALLVIDNCEQILDCGLDLMRLLQSCPELTALATSRAPLRLTGERELAAPPLEIPPANATVEELERHPAVALFLDRARAQQPDFSMDESNAATIAELCARLDGLPLAIELAASRTKLFSPKALLARLGQRLDLLAARGPDRPERHRTLRRAVEWSHELLTESERRLFRRLSVFCGGCDIDAIRHVCGDGDEAALLEALDALLQHNLAQRIDDGRGEPRFDVLETIRDLATERLELNDEADSIRAAHAAWYLAQAEAASGALTGPGQAEALDRLEMELGNLNAALDHALATGDAALGLRLAVAMWRFWLARGRIEEGARRFEALLALPTEGLDRRLLAEALHDQATLEQNRGRNARAVEILNRCLDVWRDVGDERGAANAMANLAWVHCELCRLSEAESLSREALEIHQRLGARRGEAVDWNNLGWVSAYRGRPREGLDRFGKSLDLRRAVGDRRGEAFALASMAWMEQMRGRFAEAHRLLDQAARRLLRIGDRVLLGFSLVGRASALLDEGRLAEAWAIADKALLEWRRGGNRSGEAWTLTLRGEIDVERGEIDVGAEMLEQGRRIWLSIGGKWGAAVASAALARAFADAGRWDEARTALRSALLTRREIGDRRGLAECFEILAAVDAGARPEQAGELARTAAALRVELEAPRPRRRLNAAIPKITDAAAAEIDVAGSVSEALAALG